MASKIKSIEGIFAPYPQLHYEKGQTIIHGQDEPTGVYFIKKGYVKMIAIYPDGKEITLNIFRKGQYFPIIWTFTKIVNPYYFESITPVTVQKAPREVLLNNLKKDSNLLLEFAQNAVVAIRGLILNIEHMLSGDSYHRVVAVLFLTARRLGVKTKAKGLSIRAPLTHQEIADLSGLTRESVSVAIKKLQDQNIITYDKRVLTIKDIEKLRQESTFPDFDF